MKTFTSPTVKLFGMLKTLVPGGELCVDLPHGCKVKDFVELIRRRYPEVGELVLQKKVLVSVNQEIAHWETEISKTDEIALLPPFAGGSQQSGDGGVFNFKADIRIHHKPFTAVI